MARKIKQLPQEDPRADDFDDDDFILNFRPTITFVEPEIEEELQSELEEEPPPETIDSFRDRSRKLVEGYKALKNLSDTTQRRIDQRVQGAGGLTVNLDKNKDANVIAAIKRAFPNKEDPTKITYDEYKQCLDGISKAAPDTPVITDAEIQAAKNDPLRVDFGGLKNLPGTNRPEISSDGNSIDPVDIDEFQSNALLALFKLLSPMILKEVKDKLLSPF